MNGLLDNTIKTKGTRTTSGAGRDILGLIRRLVGFGLAAVVLGLFSQTAQAQVNYDGAFHLPWRVTSNINGKNGWIGVSHFATAGDEVRIQTSDHSTAHASDSCGGPYIYNEGWTPNWICDLVMDPHIADTQLYMAYQSGTSYLYTTLIDSDNVFHRHSRCQG